MKRNVIKTGFAVLAAAAVCILCSLLAFAVDSPRMRENAEQGIAMIREEGAAPQLVGGFKTSQADNYTAVLILKTAAYEGPETLLQKAFGGYRTETDVQEGEDRWLKFCTYDGSGEKGGFSYARYWHGYVLPLRLLLCVFNLSNIEMLLYFVQTALFALVIVLAARRKLYAVLPGFVAAWFLMMPGVMGICLQYMPASLIMLAACALIFGCCEKIRSTMTLPGFFAVVGILTNYFDLLTFPLITLGFPLVAAMACLLRDGQEHSPKEMLLLMLGCCIGWGAGFGGMWALKWFITAAVFGWDVLARIISQVFLRVSTESDGVAYTRAFVLARNLKMITDKAGYLALIAGTALTAAGYAAAKLALGRKSFEKRALLLILPALLPLLWCLVMSNHCYDHYYFTYRIFAVSVFALAGAGFLAVKE